MADAATFVVDYEDCGRKTRGGERAHTSFVILFPLLRRQESLNQFEAPYVNVKSGRMSTTTFFRGEPVLYHADHKSGRSFFFVYLESLTPSPFPSSGAPKLHTPAKHMRSQYLFLRTSRRLATVPLGYNPRSCLPFFLPISPGRAKSAFPGGMSTELVPGRFWGRCIPRLLYRRREHHFAYDAVASRTEVADETESTGH